MIILLLSILNLVSSLQISNFKDLCIVGANGGLGRELVYQSLQKDKSVFGLTSKPSIMYEPYRGDDFFEETNCFTEVKNNNLTLINYWEKLDIDYNHLILCTGSQPFQEDYSDKLTKKILENLSDKCKTISLVSAYGVNQKLNYNNIGVKFLQNYFLKDTYRAKIEQEKLIYECKNIKQYIYRPKALSYKISFFFDTLTRQELASDILNQII